MGVAGRRGTHSSWRSKGEFGPQGGRPATKQEIRGGQGRLPPGGRRDALERDAIVGFHERPGGAWFGLGVLGFRLAER